MSKVIERIQKRNKWPVTLGDETIYIRAMTKREKREAREIAVADDATAEQKEDALELRGYFMFGCVLLEDDGSLAFTRGDSESVRDFASRVAKALEEVPEDFKAAIANAIVKIQTAPDTLPKN